MVALLDMLPSGLGIHFVLLLVALIEISFLYSESVLISLCTVGCMLLSKLPMIVTGAKAKEAKGRDGVKVADGVVADPGAKAKEVAKEKVADGDISCLRHITSYYWLALRQHPRMCPLLMPHAVL